MEGFSSSPCSVLRVHICPEVCLSSGLSVQSVHPLVWDPTGAVLAWILQSWIFIESENPRPVWLGQDLKDHLVAAPAMGHPLDTAPFSWNGAGWLAGKGSSSQGRWALPRLPTMVPKAARAPGLN